MNDSTSSCLIIGAGVTGLIAANILQEQGVKVTLLDKGRGVGGRLATRRIQKGVFDHGAQYFTVTSPRFWIFVEEWLNAGVIAEWTRAFPTCQGVWSDDREPRYLGVGGMTTLAKYLARALDVRLNERVISLRAENSGWQIRTEAGLVFNADALILTPPVPQSLQLIQASEIYLPPDIKAALSSVTYQPCLGVLVLVSGKSRVPSPGGVWCNDESILWISDNQQKGISPDAAALTIHLSPLFSQAFWERSDDEVLETVLPMATPYLGAEIIHAEVKRWRYSSPDTFISEPSLAVLEPAPMVFAGDAFASPCIQGATLSGLAAAERVFEMMRI